MLSARATPVGLVWTVAAGVALVLLGGGVTAATAQRWSSVGAGSSVEAQLRDRLPELTAFVERERGLPMRRTVRVEVLGDETFLAAFDDGAPVEGSEPDGFGATLEGLGLVEDAEDAEDLVGDSVDSGLVGFYDGLTERLAVRADRLDAYVEMVVVHELVHALQDQHFLLDRPGLDDGSERPLGFSALVEGDASRVEQAWRAAQSPARQAEIAEEELRRFGDAGSAGLEDVVDGTLAFPYVAGLPLVEALLADGGQARLDAAFRTPPLTSEQVLHPEQVGEGAALSPPAPDGEGEQVDEGSLGELGLAQLLGLDARDGGPQEGWDGDTYATYVDGEQTCVLATVVMADAAARDELVDALRAFLDADPVGPASLELTTCA